MPSEIEKLFEDSHCEKRNPKVDCDWFSDIDRLFSMTDAEIMENIYTFNALDKECDIKIIVDSCY